jgi:hypothetical protein
MTRERVLRQQDAARERAAMLRARGRYIRW